MNATIDETTIREALILSRKAGNYVFLPLFVAGSIVGILTLNLDPEAHHLRLLLATGVAAVYSLWILSKRPNPILLLICGLAIGLTTVLCTGIGFQALIHSNDPVPLLHVSIHAVGMTLMALHCFRMWSKLRGVSKSHIDGLLREIENAPRQPVVTASDNTFSLRPDAAVNGKHFLFGIFLVSAIFFGVRWKMNHAAMSERMSVLRGPAAKFGIKPSSSSAVWGIVLDRGNEEGTDEFIALANGFISLRMLPEGEIYNLEGETTALNRAVQDFVRGSSAFAPQTNSHEDVRLSLPGEIRFYLVTDAGLRVIAAKESELRAGNNLSPLYRQAEALARLYQKNLRLPGMYSYTNPPRFYRACIFNP